MHHNLKSFKILLYLAFLSFCIVVLSMADKGDYVIKIAILIPISLMIGTVFYLLYQYLKS
jgi:hypothetical protein